jgi:hypothetical protein
VLLFVEEGRSLCAGKIAQIVLLLNVSPSSLIVLVEGHHSSSSTE